MSPQLLLRLLTRWEILLVSGGCMILIPLVSYIASLRPRRRGIAFVPPVEKALLETPER